MSNGKCICGTGFTFENSNATVFIRQSGFCRICDKSYQQDYYRRHTDKIKANAGRWAERNPEKRKSICKKNRDSMSDEEKKCLNRRVVAYYRKKKFGITQEQFDDKFEAQGGLCAICKQPMATGIRIRVPCQDHDHITDKLRDILCSSCNLLLGHCFENVEILANAIKYLQKHAESSLIKTVCVGSVELNSTAP